MRRASVLLVLALGMVATTLPAQPALAHEGDMLARPIFERMTPDVPEIKVEIPFTANYQFLVENPTPVELTILATAGEPFIRIGPEGVFGNFKSKSWYESNVPEGLTRFPEGAEEGPDVEPVWRKVSNEPTWGWYDHRLHPVERYLAPEIREATETVRLGDWKVPILYGDQEGEIQGRFEYKPELGQFQTLLKSPENPAEGVKVQVVSARTVPAIFIENLSPEPLTVLGKEDEPFARIGPHVEVNTLSPTWIEIEQARGKTPTVPADAKAPPVWQQVAGTPRWSWPEFRAAAPDQDPPREALGRDTPTTVKNWRVPILVGDRRTDVVGITQFVPLAHLRASGGRTTGEGSPTVPVVAGLVGATLAGGYLVLRPKKKAADTAGPAARHRSRSTPKPRR